MDNNLTKYFGNMSRPIPGQGLLNDPENPYPWEKPPQFTDVTRASEYIFETLIDEDMYPELLKSLDENIPIMNIARVLLFKGFTEGLWNPDLLIRLIEPTGYMILALAERAFIDPVIYAEEASDEANEEAEEKVLFKNYTDTKEIPEGMISEKIEEQISSLPEGRPSILGDQ